jgi:hypothetical protein
MIWRNRFYRSFSGHRVSPQIARYVIEARAAVRGSTMTQNRTWEMP